MDDFHKHLNKHMQDSAFKEEWERLAPEREYLGAIIRARAEQNLTQKELAERCGIRQSNLSRIETGSASPTIATLQQVAKGVGKTLYIEFR
jgi:ribosome-binding protein aMBF1 (putative translation factor)